MSDLVLKRVAGGLQLLAQLAVVVDLAVVDALDLAVLVADRLLPALDVDDRQAAHAERGAGMGQEAVVVRPAVADAGVHRLQQLLVRRAPEPRYAAHRAGSATPEEGAACEGELLRLEGAKEEQAAAVDHHSDQYRKQHLPPVG